MRLFGCWKLVRIGFLHLLCTVQLCFFVCTSLGSDSGGQSQNSVGLWYIASTVTLGAVASLFAVSKWPSLLRKKNPPCRCTAWTNSSACPSSLNNITTYLAMCAPSVLVLQKEMLRKILTRPRCRLRFLTGCIAECYDVLSCGVTSVTLRRAFLSEIGVIVPSAMCSVSRCWQGHVEGLVHSWWSSCLHG